MNSNNEVVSGRTTEEGDEATIKFGLVTVPVVMANFNTDKAGNNAVVGQIMQMQEAILSETMAKIYQAAQAYAALCGVKFEILDGPEASRLAISVFDDPGFRQSVESSGEANYHGVVNKDGRASNDKDLLATVTRGGSTDN